MIDQTRKLREMVKQNNSPSYRRNNSARSLLKKKNHGSTCRSIAVTSGKGGVGKSNISISMAVALARLNKKVAILDGDFGLANIHILLGLIPRFNLSHVVQNECSVKDIICKGPGNISIVPGASGLLSMATMETMQLQLLLRELSHVESEFDYLLIDGGAGIGRNSIQLNCVADTILLIITPEPTSLADAYATAKILLSKGITDIFVLVNMAQSDAEGQDIFNKLKTLVKNFLHFDITLLGILPYDKNISRCVRRQKNILIEKEQSLFASRITSFSRVVCGTTIVKEGSFFARLFRSHLRKD